MKLLLHACCAPCSIECVHAFTEENITPDIFWCNPNIHPYTEYRSRRDSLRVFAEAERLSLIMDDEYGLRSFINAIEVDASQLREAGANQNRCAFCYKIRLEKTAAIAAEKKYDAFSASLLISPHQNHDLIKTLAEEIAARYGVEFLYRDFRPRFRLGQSKAREAAYYMQKYCGCIYSEEERYLNRNSNMRGSGQ